MKWHNTLSIAVLVVGFALTSVSNRCLGEAPRGGGQTSAHPIAGTDLHLQGSPHILQGPARSMTALGSTRCHNCPPGAPPEPEACGDDTNDGCNIGNPAFTEIACGESYCSTSWATATNRDTDWYQITLTEARRLTFTATADFPILFGVWVTNPGGSGDCSDSVPPFLSPLAEGDPCETVSVTICAEPGTWWLFVAVNDFVDTACGSGGENYVVELSCTSCDVPEPCVGGDGDCCSANFTTGCNDEACCTAVCSADSYCCNTNWDSTCANLAFDLCSLCVVPSNDDCADAEAVAIGSSTPGSTIGAALEPEFPDCDDPITAPGVWYSVIGNGHTLTATTCNTGGDEYDTRISVYCGGCDAPVCVGGNDDDCSAPSGFLSTATFCSDVDTEYLILVHGFGSAIGAFQFDVLDEGTCSQPSTCEPVVGACCVDNACIGTMPAPACTGLWFEGETCATVDCPGPCTTDTCADAFPIASVPFQHAGNTCTCANDYDEVCPYVGSTAPDLVYTFTPSEDVVVDIRLCDSGYDTKLYVYDGGCPGVRVGCNDDSCSASGGDPFQSRFFGLLLAADHTYYIIIDGFDDSCGAYELDIREVAAPPICPPGGWVGQPPHRPDDSWTAGTSDAGHAASVIRYEEFSAGSDVCAIRFWGLNAFNDGGGWLACSEDPMPFEIKFHQDAGGQPGAAVCSNSVLLTGTPTGRLYSGSELIAYIAIINPCCALQTGWVSVQGAGDPNCWFLWMSAAVGDGSSCFFDGTEIICDEPGESDFDLNLCLTGSGSACPSGTATFNDPPDGVVDARQPHPVGSTSPMQGIDTIEVAAPSGVSSCWSLCETGDGGLGANGIADIADNGDGTYTISLVRPITPGEVTTLTYTPDDGGAEVTASFIAHPANVNGDTAASPLDILKMIDCVNGVDPGVNCPWGVYSCDMNHSAECNSADILRVIDLLNGADTFVEWNGTALPVNDGSCP